MTIRPKLRPKQLARQATFFLGEAVLDAITQCHDDSRPAIFEVIVGKLGLEEGIVQGTLLCLTKEGRINEAEVSGTPHWSLSNEEYKIRKDEVPS